MPDKQNFGARLALLRNRLGQTQQDIADVIGVSKSAVSGLENGNSFPVPDKLVKLARHFGVSVDYLLTGEAIVDSPTLRSDYSSFKLTDGSSATIVADDPVPYIGAAKGAALRILAVQVGPDNEENIELVSVRAAAGYAAGGFLREEFIEKLPSFRLPDPAYRNGSFRAFQVSGESMQSTLYEGDWVICRYVERWDRDIRDTYVHVVVTEESILVKRVNNRLTERGQLTLHSDNPAYPVQFIDGEQVREMWVAVGKLSRQFINPRYDVNVELARHSATLEELLSRIERLEKDHRPKGH